MFLSNYLIVIIACGCLLLNVQSIPRGLRTQGESQSLDLANDETDTRREGGRWDSIPPETVSALDGAAYLGRWYQTFGSLISNVTFERNGFCVVADYTATTPTEVKILNSQLLGGPTGELQQIEGILTPQSSDGSSPGKWMVRFGPGMRGFYWVIDLGPLNADGLYSYSVVSVPFGYDVYILARDVANFRLVYQDALLLKLKLLGFNTFVNEPRPTYQGDDCQYPPIPK